MHSYSNTLSVHFTLAWTCTMYVYVWYNTWDWSSSFVQRHWRQGRYALELSLKPPTALLARLSAENTVIEPWYTCSCPSTRNEYPASCCVYTHIHVYWLLEWCTECHNSMYTCIQCTCTCTHIHFVYVWRTNFFKSSRKGRRTESNEYCLII